MQYRRLGRSGLQVSELSLGSWVTYHNQVNTTAAREMLAAKADALLAIGDAAIDLPVSVRGEGLVERLRPRLERRLADALAELRKAEGKLANERFVARAPQEVGSKPETLRISSRSRFEAEPRSRQECRGRPRSIGPDQNEPGGSVSVHLAATTIRPLVLELAISRSIQPS